MLDAIQSFDASVLLFVQEHLRGDFLDAVMKFITHLGDAGAIWIAAGVILLFFKGTRKGGIMVLLGLLGSLLVTNLVLKNLFDRTRPYEVIQALTILIDAEHSASFPSGHTASSFVAAYMLARAFPKKGAFAYILAALIAWSRVHVGVHYPTDILGGVAAGVLTGMLVWFLAEKIWALIQQKMKARG